MKSFILSSLSFLIILFSITSCLKDEEYTTSANDVLEFSSDTIAFDTIISGTPTNTYTFTVYNRSSKAIRIPNVTLQLGAQSPFKVTVDGMPLIEGSANDFEIASQDSMIVYLFANVPEEDNDNPVPISDNLIFTTEAGVQQKIVLTASGQAVKTLSGYRVQTDTTFQLKRPYRIMDSLVVEKGRTLTLNPGTKLYFHPKATLIVYGTLKVNGTLDNPILMRGDRLGNMFAGQPYDRIPGQWGGIKFKESSYGNHLSYADIHSCQFGIQCDSSDVNTEKIKIENSIIHNTTHHAIDLRMTQATIGNTQITNAGGNCLNIYGGNVSLIHCTIARFFVFTGGNGVALHFSNFDNNIRLPLQQLRIENSIITGYQSDEILGERNSKFEKDPFNYKFSNCLLNTPETDDENIINCLWESEKEVENNDSTFTRENNFTPKPDLDALTFSFELSPKSKAVGKANPQITESTYATDRLGRVRLPRPDMGCYQHQVPTTNK